MMSVDRRAAALQIFGEQPILAVGERSDEEAEEAEEDVAFHSYSLWHHGGSDAANVRRAALEGAEGEGGR